MACLNEKSTAEEIHKFLLDHNHSILAKLLLKHKFDGEALKTLIDCDNPKYLCSIFPLSRSDQKTFFGILKESYNSNPPIITKSFEMSRNRRRPLWTDEETNGLLKLCDKYCDATIGINFQAVANELEAKFGTPRSKCACKARFKHCGALKSSNEKNGKRNITPTKSKNNKIGHNNNNSKNDENQKSSNKSSIKKKNNKNTKPVTTPKKKKENTIIDLTIKKGKKRSRHNENESKMNENSLDNLILSHNCNNNNNNKNNNNNNNDNNEKNDDLISIPPKKKRKMTKKSKNEISNKNMGNDKSNSNANIIVINSLSSLPAPKEMKQKAIAKKNDSNATSNKSKVVKKTNDIQSKAKTKIKTKSKRKGIKKDDSKMITPQKESNQRKITQYYSNSSSEIATNDKDERNDKDKSKATTNEIEKCQKSKIENSHMKATGKNKENAKKRLKKKDKEIQKGNQTNEGKVKEKKREKEKEKEKEYKPRVRKGYTLRAGDVIWWLNKHGNNENNLIYRASIITQVWKEPKHRDNSTQICFDFWPKYARCVPTWNTAIKLNWNDDKDSLIKLKNCNFVYPTQCTILMPESFNKFDNLPLNHLNYLYGYHILSESGINEISTHALHRAMLDTQNETNIPWNPYNVEKMSDYFSSTDGLIEFDLIDEKEETLNDGNGTKIWKKLDVPC